jgi:hypothetical protein
MRTLSRLIVLSALLSGGAVLAARPVQNFEPPPEMTEEEKAALKAKQLGGGLNGYDKDIQIKETPVPWGAIGLAGLVFLVATPFAVRAYRSTTKEIADVNTVGVTSRGADEEEA